MKWVNHEENSMIPDWLKSALPSTCKCGGKVLDGYNESNQLTRRICDNPECPYIMGMKIGKLCDMLGIAGIKGGNGTKIAKSNHLTSHLLAMPFITYDHPRITLARFFQLALFYDQFSIFESICREYSTVSDFIESYRGPLLCDILNRKDELLEAEQYFEIISADTLNEHKVFPTVVSGEIVITGNVSGVSNREMYPAFLNKKFKGLVDISYCNNKRATGIICVIQEDKRAKSSLKVTTAIDNGIPIMTSAEFAEYLMRRIISAGKIEELKLVLSDTREEEMST